MSHFALVGLSASIGFTIALSIHLATLLVMYFMNIAFTVYLIVKSQRDDAPFKHWCSYHDRLSTLYFILTSCLSFKMARCFYARVFKGSKYFDAAFDSKFESIIRPMFITSMINFVCVSVPIILADLYTLMAFNWRYEIAALAFDNLLLALVIFVLEIIEFKKARASYTVEPLDFLPTLRKIKLRTLRQTMVQSSLPEGAAPRDEESLGGPRGRRQRTPRRRSSAMYIIDD